MHHDPRMLLGGAALVLAVAGMGCGRDATPSGGPSGAPLATQAPSRGVDVPLGTVAVPGSPMEPGQQQAAALDSGTRAADGGVLPQGVVQPALITPDGGTPCISPASGSVSLTGVLQRESHSSHEPGRPQRMFYLQFTPPICVRGVIDADFGTRRTKREVRVVGIAETSRLYAALGSHVGAQITMRGQPVIPHMGGMGSFCLFNGAIGE